jgi:hypothetical protein
MSVWQHLALAAVMLAAVFIFAAVIGFAFGGQ